MIRFFSRYLPTTLLIPIAILAAGPVLAEHVTLLHTSDLHSHYRPDTDEAKLGGLARLRTAIDLLRKKNPHTLLVDGGDWSEGQIYYTVGTGRETLKLMDSLSYDAAIVGNHDWLNGPDALLQSAQEAKLGMAMLAANISTDAYPKRKEFNQLIVPYVIKKVGGVKVAFIGLVTWEFIYDRWLTPIKILSPFDVVRDLTEMLKSKADAIVVISHNGQKLNEQILAKNSDVDVVVGAHDHKLLLHPTEVARAGKAPSWLVDGGKWGKYLGKVELEVRPRAEALAAGKPSVELLSFEALPIDARYSEDLAIAKKVDAIEAQVTHEFGDIHHDHVADSELLVQDRAGAESLLGNLSADAYVEAAHADLSIESNGFLYSELHPGAIRTADLFNSNPGVFNPVTRKSWPVRVLPMSGITLQWLLGLLFSSDQVAAMGKLSASHLDVIYGSLFGGGGPLPAASAQPFNPFTFFQPLAAPAFPNVVSIRVDGKPLNLFRIYKVALSGGAYSAVEFINSWIPGAVPTFGVEDTGIESWRAVLDRVKSLKKIRLADVYAPGTRLQRKGPSIGLFNDDISMTPLQETADGIWARVRVRVRNFGQSASTAGKSSVELFSNVGTYDSDELTNIPGQSIGAAQTTGAIPSGGDESLEWEKVFIPKSALTPPTGSKAITSLVIRMASESGELTTAAFEASKHWLR